MNKKHEWIVNYINEKGYTNILNLGFCYAYTENFYKNDSGLKAEKDLGRQLSLLYKKDVLTRWRVGRLYQNGLPKWYYEYDIKSE